MVKSSYIINNLIMVSREVLINFNVIDLWSCSDLVDGASRKGAGIAFKNMAVVNISHLLKIAIDLCVLDFVPNEVYMSVKCSR